MDSQKEFLQLKKKNIARKFHGWDGGIRTPECRDQNPVAYHLATSQRQK